MGIVAEEWRSVEGYEGHYEISNRGRFRSLPRTVHYEDGRVCDRPGLLISQHMESRGYVQARISKDGKRRAFMLHRLVAAAFLGACPDGMQVNHIDGNKTNNCVENLEYMTPGDNQRHAYRTHLKVPKVVWGEKQGSAKLSNSEAAEVRRLRLGGMKLREVAEMFGICQQTVSDIALGKARKHLLAINS